MAGEQIALISDPHGNVPALEAVLADIERRGISRIICLGDLAGKGPDGAAVVDCCRDRCEHVIRGNWDESLAADWTTEEPWAQWHRAQLGPDRLAYLASLPNAVTLQFGGRAIRLLHASPVSVHHRVHQNAPVEALLAMFDTTGFTGESPAPDVVGYGDIHVPYLRTFGRRTLFNVGSVGNPLDVPLACYAIIASESGSARPDTLSISLVRVSYDIERAIADARRVNMPELRPYEIELRTATFQRGRNAPDAATPESGAPVPSPDG
jgi:protein phosphatase